MALLLLLLLLGVAPFVCYLALLCLLSASTPLPVNLFYLNRLPLVNRKKLNFPEVFGFLSGQATPFLIATSDGEALHAWHIVPSGVYNKHERELQAAANGLVPDITATPSFRLLRNNPNARVVISYHGTAGCLASDWRPYNYRNLYSAAPDDIHVVALDYRGYGLSTGSPSEAGLTIDSIAAIDWIINTAGISPERVTIFAHSLGTAVGLAVLNHCSAQRPPISFAGAGFTACFSDVASLLSTYRIEGIIPVLSPLARIPPLLAFFTSFLRITWLSKDRLANYIRICESEGRNYCLTFLHSEDDQAITCQHTKTMFWHAVNATGSGGITYADLDKTKSDVKESLDQGGWKVEWRTSSGVLRQHMVKYGGHDKVMALPAVALAVLCTFRNVDPAFGTKC